MMNLFDADHYDSTKSLKRRCLDVLSGKASRRGRKKQWPHTHTHTRARAPRARARTHADAHEAKDVTLYVLSPGIVLHIG